MKVSDNLQRYSDVAHRVDTLVDELVRMPVITNNLGLHDDSGFYVAIAVSLARKEISDTRKEINERHYGALFDLLESRLDESYNSYMSKGRKLVA